MAGGAAHQRGAIAARLGAGGAPGRQGLFHFDGAAWSATATGPRTLTSIWAIPGYATFGVSEGGGVWMKVP